MSSEEKIHISPTLLGVIITLVLALFVGGVKYGDLNGRLTLVESITDFKELNEQQTKLKTSLNKQILDAQKKLENLKKGLDSQQLQITTIYHEAENKFNEEIYNKFSEISIKAEKLMVELDNSINNSSDKKKVILSELSYGVESELVRVNKLTKKLRNNLEKLKIEIARNKRTLSSLKIKISEIKNLEKNLLSGYENKQVSQSLEKPVIEISKTSGRNQQIEVKKPVIRKEQNISKKTTERKRKYYVRIGSFKNRSGADKIKTKVKKLNYSVVVKKRGGLYRVEVGYYSNRSEARKIKKKIEKNKRIMKEMKSISVEKE